jgi:hypothetical protein
MSSNVASTMGSIKSSIAGKIGEAATSVGTSLDNIAKAFTDKLQTAKENAEKKLGEIVGLFETGLAPAETNTDTALGKVLTAIDTKLGDAKTAVEKKLGEISTAISTEAGKWKEAVKGEIDAVKTQFKDFSWDVPEFPELTCNWGDTIKAAIKAVKDQFPANFSWNIPELKMPVKLPKYKTKGEWEFDKKGNIKKVPEITVEWYRKAAELGALFNEPTIIGVGDASQPEMLIGEETLYKQIRAAVGEVNGINQNLTINAPQGLDAAETARLVRNQTRQLLARMKGGL